MHPGSGDLLRIRTRYAMLKPHSVCAVLLNKNVPGRAPDSQRQDLLSIVSHGLSLLFLCRL